MTNEQAYQRGVKDVLAIMSAAADRIEVSPALLLLRRELAAETLRAVTIEAGALIVAPVENTREKR